MQANRFEASLKKIGANVRRIRKSQGLTMEAVAHAAEIEYRQLGKIERGEGNITIISLLRIAEVLKVEINQFV